jgi:hypothetical protein
MLFISERTWRKIREDFSESEKARLRSTIANDVLGPVRGWDIQADELESELREKILGHVLVLDQSRA